MCRGVQKFFKINKSDIIYTALPLYHMHTNANVSAMGQMITLGCTVALCKKFSASKFWDDCIKYECTVSKVIGSIIHGCMYIYTGAILEGFKSLYLRFI